MIDAQNKQHEFIATISKRNLNSLNPEVDIRKGITRVVAPNVIIRFTKLVSEKIPIFITQPIGEAPRGYQYLDIWPYQLALNVSGPEEVVKRLLANHVNGPHGFFFVHNRGWPLWTRKESGHYHQLLHKFFLERSSVWDDEFL